MVGPAGRPNTLALLEGTAMLIAQQGADSPEVESFIGSNAGNPEFLTIARLGQALWRGLRNPLPGRKKKKHKKRKKHRK